MKQTHPLPKSFREPRSNLRQLQQVLGALPLARLIEKNNFYSGNKEDESLGEDIEFHSSHPYQEGLPAKNIDWRLYQRIQKLYIKRFSSLKKKTLHICVDTSLSMLNHRAVSDNFFIQDFIYFFCYYLYLQKQDYYLHFINDEQHLFFHTDFYQNNFSEIKTILSKIKFKTSNNHLRNFKKIIPHIEPKSNFIYISDFQTELDELKKIPVLLNSLSLSIKYLIYFDKLVLDITKKNKNYFLSERETNKKFFLKKKTFLKLEESILNHYKKLQILCNQQNIEYHTLNNTVSPLQAFIDLFV